MEGEKSTMNRALRYCLTGGCRRVWGAVMTFTLAGMLFYMVTITFAPSTNVIRTAVKTVPGGTVSSVTNNGITESQPLWQFSNLTYKQALENRASPNDKVILLALIDSGCLDVGLNFYLTSIKRFDIKNYLLISSDRSACEFMWKEGVACFLYKEDADAGKPSVYHSKDFLRKMNIRTFMILDALEMGFNVLHSDVDIVFLGNPMQDVVCHNDCHLNALWDESAYNAGFLYVKACPESITLYKDMKQLTFTSPKTDDQASLNKCIRKGRKYNLIAKKLPGDQYQNGLKFWEKGKRAFVGDNPCDKCIVVHNNWIVSMEAKIYRFKELGMWMNDIGKYYSDTNRKYLVFGTPLPDPEADKKALRSALAIGKILNRVVILPTFHCGEKKDKPCTIINHIKLRSFEKIFSKDKYREHSFLSHPLVPKEITESQTEQFLVNTTKASTLKGVDGVKVYTPANREKGASEDEIKNWFGSRAEEVLNFHSLYDAFCCFSNSTSDSAFEKDISSALVKGAYRQFK